MDEAEIYLDIKVVPKSSRNKIVGYEGHELKIRLAAVPEKGQANRELIKFLANELGISQSRIVLIHGETSRKKRICILQPDEKVIQKLKEYGESASEEKKRGS